jgi:hypothetical protein
LIAHATGCVAATLLLAAVAMGQTSGSISGRVVDESAHPIAGAQVELRPGSRRTVSDDDGRFTYRNVAPGAYAMDVRRIGYQARSMPVDVRSTDVSATITLVAIPQLLDSVRIRERDSRLRYSATVLDETGAPVPDVAVVVAGIDNKLRTDSSGHFVIPKMVRGTLMIRMRKIGYGAWFGTLRMLAEREDTLRMSRLAQTLSQVQILEQSGFGRDTFAYRDLDQRMRWKNHQASVISREELDEQGRAPLCLAMAFTPTGGRYGFHCNDRMCVILNGERRTLLSPNAFWADQVESVEYYPSKSDWSGTLFSRDCPDPRRTEVLVIWMRKGG